MSNQVFHVFQAMKDTPPPRFRNGMLLPRECAKQIAVLEKELGLEHGPFISNIEECNLRLNLLQSQGAARHAAAAAPAPAPVQKTPAAMMLEKYRAISDTFKRTECYRTNSTLIDQGHNEEAAAAKPAPQKLTGEPIIDRLNSFTDTLEKGQHYRENRIAVDAAYRRLHRSATS